MLCEFFELRTEKSTFMSCSELKCLKTGHFTVVCLVAKTLNRNEAKGDLVMI